MNSFFKKEIATSVQGGNMSVQLGVGSYSYRRSSLTTNGVVKVRSGMCIDKIVVTPLNDDSLLRVLSAFNSLGKLEALVALRDAGILRSDYSLRTVNNVVKEIPFSNDKDRALDLFDSL